MLVRHAESEFNILHRLNGDAAIEVRLTAAGRDQARELGRRVGAVDLVAYTEFARTRETAELAWPGSPTLVVHELNEIKFGRFEGSHWDDGYHEWVLTSGPDEDCPGGGESRLTAVRRYLRGYRTLLERPERRVALVGHGAPIRYVLLALEDLPPLRVLEGVPPAEPVAVSADELRHVIELLEAWAGAPSF